MFSCRTCVCSIADLFRSGLSLSRTWRPLLLVTFSLSLTVDESPPTQAFSGPVLCFAFLAFWEKRRRGGAILVCSSVRLFACPLVRSFVRSSVRSSVRSFVRSSVRSFVRQFVRSFVRQFVRQFVSVSVCPCARVSVCQCDSVTV